MPLPAACTGLPAVQRPRRIEYASWLSDFDFKAPIALYLDQLSLALTLMITFVCGLIHLYSVGYMKDDPSYARYFALLNIFVFAMLVLVLAENLPLLYLGWEGVGFCSYALIGFWYTRGEERHRRAQGLHRHPHRRHRLRHRHGLDVPAVRHRARSAS